MSTLRTYPYGSDSIALGRSRFMSRVYTWMTAGVTLTSLVAVYIGSNVELVVSILRNPILYYGLIIAQLGMVITLSAAVQRLSTSTARLLYLAYAALTGVTLSVIFMVYTQDSIATVFGATACGFGGLSIIGYTTKRDLGPVGAFCGMALFGMIGYALLSFFFSGLRTDGAMMIYSGIGVLVFAGLTAYDTQKIKAMYDPATEGSDAEAKGAIYGALALYLDFINLFLSLLRLFGRRK